MPRKRKGLRKILSRCPSDWSRLTVDQLRTQCKYQGLDTGGKKEELVKKLDQHNHNDEPPAKFLRATTLHKAISIVRKRIDRLPKKEPSSSNGESSSAAHVFLPDRECPLKDVSVLKNYACQLNQANIGFNSNKFFILQILDCELDHVWNLNGEKGHLYYLWTRYGRVGLKGKSGFKTFSKEEDAIAAFRACFADKTRNEWEERKQFKAVPGKYSFIDLDLEAVQNQAVDSGELASREELEKPGSKLNSPTQDLLTLLFDNETFSSRMNFLHLDTDRLPLGKLSLEHIMKGFKILHDVQAYTKRRGGERNRAKLIELSNAFYSLIPHNFGQKPPPVIDTKELLRARLDTLVSLSNIKEAMELRKQQELMAIERKNDHPLDIQYKLLDCDLELLKPDSDEYKRIEKYFDSTRHTNALEVDVEKQGKTWALPCEQISNVWRISRKNEAEKYLACTKNMKNRKLLWHGTDFAAGVAILKSGLRSGSTIDIGDACNGIFFGSECSTAAYYASDKANKGCLEGVSLMFLAEVALGKEYHMKTDDWDVKKQPGHDSVIKQGRQEPEKECDAVEMFDGMDVTVPQGEPVQQHGWEDSEILQSEYIVHNPDQIRLRYLVLVKYGRRHLLNSKCQVVF